MYFLMELVSGGELLDALDALGLLKYSQADVWHFQVRQEKTTLFLLDLELLLVFGPGEATRCA